MADEDRRFSLWTVLTTAAIVGSAMASGGWYVARARIDDELRQYERSKTWQLPQLLADLRVVSAGLRSEISDRKEFQRLRATLPIVERQNATLATQLAARSKEIAELRLQLGAFTVTTFELQRGEAHEIIPGEIVVGLKDASNILGKAEVQFGGTLREIAPGATMSASYDKVEYRVTLLKIIDGGLGEPDTASFRVTRHAREKAVQDDVSR
jgi:hypothetical protein